jgi:hypothetical protein
VAGSVRVRGLRETLRALDRVNKGVGKQVKDELKKAAEPVAKTAQSKISRYAGAKTSTIGPRASVRGVFVTQRARKVTGIRADFGRLQQGLLEESLQEHEGEIIHDVERAFDRLTRSEGF